MIIIFSLLFSFLLKNVSRRSLLYIIYFLLGVVNLNLSLWGKSRGDLWEEFYEGVLVSCEGGAGGMVVGFMSSFFECFGISVV